MNKLKLNQYVRLHPATDLFMMGVTEAQIIKLGPKWITLYHYSSDTKHKVSMNFAKAYFMNDKADMIFDEN